ncbi:beta-fibrinogenase brevinase-like [Copidosoma floridanum]|uniref:beta-fibrinogenase brevinase-like n=1 Tax=Copidosoma floridanum TaxID=29053 RepID=UPI0006C9789D|nr:beta-fibrinogenase brevinase-like [Copidosoma floridanum]
MDSRLLSILFAVASISVVTGYDDGRFRYQVAIYSDSFICGGALIKPDIVLTSAHCVKDAKNPPKKVYAGVMDLNDPEFAFSVQWKLIKEIYAHAKYQSNENETYPINDIALLKLESALELNDYVNTIKLPKRGEDFHNKTAVVAGYGWDSLEITTNSEGKPVRHGASSLYLRFAKVTVTASLEGFPSTILGGQVEQTPGSKNGACDGDHGSPLVVDGDKVIGVLSSTPFDCDETRRPSYYTKVSEYLDFIQKSTDGKSVKEKTE